MEVMIRGYLKDDIPQMIDIWNQIVEEGEAFPQLDYLDLKNGTQFFDEQTHCGVAVMKDSGKVVGLYILHPNNVGRCGHIANASYAIFKDYRGMKIGEKLVSDSLAKAKEFGFRIMQFNAVVRTNIKARSLYVKLGFIPLGTIFGGFKMKDGPYEDIVPYYFDLTKLDD